MFAPQPWPESYIEYRVMKGMGWSWQELQATPDFVVAQVVEWLEVEGTVQPDLTGI